MIAARSCGVLALRGLGAASSSTAIVNGDGAGHVQSLILGAVLIIAALLLVALGVIGDLLAGAAHAHPAAASRRVRRVELKLGVAPSHYERGAGHPSRRAAT